MTMRPLTLLLMCFIAVASGIGDARAADQTATDTTVTADAGKTIRTMDARRLGGTNVATWYLRSVYDSSEVRK